MTTNTRVASFDIGERNFAFCVGSRTTIFEWEHLDVKKKKTQTVDESCLEVSDVLLSFDWSECDHIIIERQMKVNQRAINVARHVWTWFSVMYPSIKRTFFPASKKTQFFVGKNTMTKPQRKKWAVEKAREMLKAREENGDENCTRWLEVYNSHAKKDDLADTFLQMMAFLKVTE
jgi:hypothetical protein